MVPPSNDSPVPAPDSTDIKLPWSVTDAWIGLILMAMIQLALFVSVSYYKPLKMYEDPTIVFVELLYLLPVVAIMIWRRADWRLLGYRRFTGQVVGLGCGLLVASYLVTMVNNTIFILLGQKVQADKIIALLEKLGSPFWLVVVGVIVAPLVEETFFRGFLFAGFRQRYGWKIAALLSSAFFSIAHLNWAALVPTFMLGFGFAYLYHKSNSIWPGVILHFLVNGIAFCALLTMMRFGAIPS